MLILYITPSSSTYFSDAEIANLQAKSQEEDTSYVIVGDLNSRFGKQVSDLINFVPSCGNQLRYNPIDLGVNDNGKKVLSICKDNNLVVINNLQTESKSFTSALTYRERNKWKSELDICITSRDLIHTVSQFQVNQNMTFPSNHAPVSVCFTFPERTISLHEMASRSQDIGMYPPRAPKSLCKRPIRFHQVDVEAFRQNIENSLPPVIQGDVNVIVEEFNEQLYGILKASKSRHQNIPFDTSINRWERIMKCEDDSLMWKAIDWKGQFDPSNANSDVQPSEAEFNEHLQKLLNPSGESVSTNLLGYNISIPVLDKTLEVKVVSDVEKQVKPDKMCGPDGNNPGVFKSFPDIWISFLCMLFNVVFITGYPVACASAKLIMLFKKGARLDCDNYRGISIMNSVAKIYDYVLNNRLMQWYKPCREQAGRS